MSQGERQSTFFVFPLTFKCSRIFNISFLRLPLCEQKVFDKNFAEIQPTCFHGESQKIFKLKEICFHFFCTIYSMNNSRDSVAKVFLQVRLLSKSNQISSGKIGNRIFFIVYLLIYRPHKSARQNLFHTKFLFLSGLWQMG